jgi:putative nucleotidyltransferase with HDIG domain
MNPNRTTTSVPSGEFVLSRGDRRALEACVGSCVGVTLCDPRARVGGLIHLLLSEPSGAGFFHQAKSYATTGVPLFIKALYNEGAREGALEACVAGGALLGPPSAVDLDLDIGGRTSEMVEDALGREGIPIVETETGGFCARRMLLDLRNWKTQIEPLGLSGPTTARSKLKRPSSADLRAAMEGVRPIPQIALKVIRMIQDQAQSMADVAREIRQDQVVSGRVIRLSNSAFFNMKVKPESIDRAVVMLGEKRFLRLAVSASLEGFFPEQGRGYSLCKGGLYKHALGAAMTAERLARMTRCVSTDVAYTAGLLHDIGKVVLDQFVARAWPLFYRRTQEDGSGLVEVEQEVIGVSHTEVGGRLGEQWSFPAALIDAIRHHHHPEKAAVNSELTHVVYLADLFMSRFVAGQELEQLNTDLLAQRLAKIGLSPKDFPMMVDTISRDIFHQHP